MNKQEIVLVGFKDLDINEAELIVTNLQNKINNSLNSKEYFHYIQIGTKYRSCYC